MDSYVIDTNFFFNLEVKSGFGSSAPEIVKTFVKLATKLKEEKKAHFYMPPSIVEEIASFDDSHKDYVHDLLTVVTVQSPDVSKVQFPAAIFYTLVDEIRSRSYRGLTIAAEQVEAAGQLVSGKTFENKMEYQKTMGEVVTKLRERYRQATRFNFLDSVADLDLIVLARELDAYLVSADEGVIRWGRMFGVKEVAADMLLKRLT